MCCMATCSRVLALLVAASTVAVVAGCGDYVVGPRAPSTVSRSATPSVVPDSRARAQQIVDDAEKRLIEDLSARYTMAWVTADSTVGDMALGTGGFDLRTPAAYQVIEVPEEFRIEYRLIEEHGWVLIGTSGGPEALGSCWFHTTRGTGEEAKNAAVPPPALMLVEPSADGMVEGAAEDGAERVAVDLLLDEAASAVMPQIANKSARGIDPTATIRGVVTVRDGRYAALEYRIADVLDALDPADVPAEVRSFGDGTADFTVRFEYADFGADIDVRPPPAREVMDIGDQADLLAGGPDGAPSVEPCAAAR